MWNHTFCCLLCLLPFTWYDNFVDYPCRGRLSVLHSFLWLNNTLLCGQTALCWSIHLLAGIWVIPSFAVLRMKLLWSFVHKSWCGHLCSFLLGQYLGMNMVGSHDRSTFNFRSDCWTASTGAGPLHIPISKEEGSHFPPSSPALVLVHPFSSFSS